MTRPLTIAEIKFHQIPQQRSIFVVFPAGVMQQQRIPQVDTCFWMIAQRQIRSNYSIDQLVNGLFVHHQPPDAAYLH